MKEDTARAQKKPIIVSGRKFIPYSEHTASPLLDYWMGQHVRVLADTCHQDPRFDWADWASSWATYVGVGLGINPHHSTLAGELTYTGTLVLAALPVTSEMSRALYWMEWMTETIKIKDIPCIYKDHFVIEQCGLVDATTIADAWIRALADKEGPQ